MAVASEVVPQGQIGTGEAQVFGSPTDVLGIVRQNRQITDAKKAARANQEAADKEKRDERVSKLLEFNPEEAYQPFNDQVINSYKTELSDYMIDSLAKGVDINSPKFKADWKGRTQNVDNIARFSNYIKETIDSTKKEIAADPYRDSKYYNSKINDVYLDPSKDMKLAKNWTDINTTDFDKVIDDPGGVNMNKYATDFVSNLNENMIEFTKERYNAMGVVTTEDQIKSNLYVLDENQPNGLAKDPDGNLILKVDNDFVKAFKQYKGANDWIAAEVEKTGQSEKDVIESLVSPYAYKQKTTQHKLTKYDKDAGSGSKMLKKATERLSTINTLQNAYYDAAGNRLEEASDDAERELGRIKTNAEFDGLPIVDATFVKGGESKKGKDGEEQYDEVNLFGNQHIEGSPNDRIVFKLKGGTSSGRVQYTTGTVDLTNPGAGATLNTVFETSTGETSGLEWDKMLELNDEEGGSLYRNRYKKEPSASFGSGQPKVVNEGGKKIKWIR